MSALTLTQEQEAARKGFTQFILNKNQHSYVLSGFAGTGKTTLVKYLLEQLPDIERTARLLQPTFTMYDVCVTATTNKACSVLQESLGGDRAEYTVTTIHSLLQLVVSYFVKERKHELAPRKGTENFLLQNKIVLIEEASFIGLTLLSWIRKRTQNCKIFYIGDPGQLLEVGSTYSPVFAAQLPTDQLTEIVRQAKGNPIIELATNFRNVLETGKFFSFKPDGKYIRHLPREEFDKEVVAEFTANSWNDAKSRILTWTNKGAISYNDGLSKIKKGTSAIRAGDYCVVNNFTNICGNSFAAESIIRINNTSPMEYMGVKGTEVILNDEGLWGFCPDEYLTIPKIARNMEREFPGADQDEISHYIAQFIGRWIDLRAAYSCTVNKSQGSTYDRVYIDLDDIKKCNNGLHLARLLYVGTSRARYQVTFTGDIT